jgi:hypothetical protein
MSDTLTERKLQAEERKKQFAEVKELLKTLTLPKEPVRINKGVQVMDCKKFVSVNIPFIESAIDKEISIPYLLGLIEFANIVKELPENKK